MRLFIAVSLLLSGIAATAQTWTDLGAGTQQDSVKPQDCANTGSPAYCNGVTFPYAANNFNIVAAWSGGVARTKVGSEQMLLWGGGHVATFDNSVYAVNLFNNTVSALTTPSIPYGSGSPVTNANITCVAPNADGSPVSHHGYKNTAYLPVADKMFFFDFQQDSYCGSQSPSNVTNDVWLFDPVAKTWSIADNAFNLTVYSGPQLASCAADTSFGITAHETVICYVVYAGARGVFRWDSAISAPRWTTLISPVAGLVAPYSGTAVIDPVRKLLFLIGTTGDTGNTTLQILKIDISNSSYTTTDVTASTSGCSSTINVAYPGAVYDNVTGGGNIMVWPGPGSGNTVYEFNPVTYVCTAYTASGGPPSPAHANAGTFGRFGAYPSLGGFVVVNSTTNDAFLFTLAPISPVPATARNGQLSTSGALRTQ